MLADDAAHAVARTVDGADAGGAGALHDADQRLVDDRGRAAALGDEDPG